MGKFTYGFLVNEAFFSAEAIHDFAWEPQNVRTVLGRASSVGLLVACDAEVKSIAGLNGKRIGNIEANPLSQHQDRRAAGLRPAHPHGCGGGTLRLLFADKDRAVASQTDVFLSVTTSARAREIQAGPRGLYWPSYDPEDAAGWKTVTDVVSLAGPMREPRGAGLSEENVAWLIGTGIR